MQCEEPTCDLEEYGQCQRCGLHHCERHCQKHADVPCGPRVHPNMRRPMPEIREDLQPRMASLYKSESEEKWFAEFYARCYDPNEAFCMAIWAEGLFGKPFTLALLLFVAKSLEEHPDWRAEDVDLVQVYGYAGDLLYELDRFGEAEEQFRKALSVSIKSDDCWTETVGLAASAKGAKHWSAAAEAFAWAAGHYHDANPQHMLLGEPAKDTWPLERLSKEAEDCACNAKKKGLFAKLFSSR